MFVWPWIEAWITSDQREHHILDRPRNAPDAPPSVWPCGLVLGDVGCCQLGPDGHALPLSLNDVTNWLRALFFAGPILGFIVTRRICLALQRKDREIALHGRETGRIGMSACRMASSSRSTSR